MLLCCSSKRGFTTTFELRNYFKEKRDLSTVISTRDIYNREKTSKLEIFPSLNRKYLMDFYRSDETQTVEKAIFVNAIDGASEVPNPKDNREAFEQVNQHSGKGQVRAL